MDKQRKLPHLDMEKQRLKRTLWLRGYRDNLKFGSMPRKPNILPKKETSLIVLQSQEEISPRLKRIPTVLTKINLDDSAEKNNKTPEKVFEISAMKTPKSTEKEEIMNINVGSPTKTLDLTPEKSPAHRRIDFENARLKIFDKLIRKNTVSKDTRNDSINTSKEKPATEQYPRIQTNLVKEENNEEVNPENQAKSKHYIEFIKENNASTNLLKKPGPTASGKHIDTHKKYKLSPGIKKLHNGKSARSIRSKKSKNTSKSTNKSKGSQRFVPNTKNPIIGSPMSRNFINQQSKLGQRRNTTFGPLVAGLKNSLTATDSEVKLKKSKSEREVIIPMKSIIQSLQKPNKSKILSDITQNLPYSPLKKDKTRAPLVNFTSQLNGRRRNQVFDKNTAQGLANYFQLALKKKMEHTKA